VRGFSPATLIWEVPPESQPGVEPPEVEGDELTQTVSDTYHGPVRIRTALANDYLLAAAQVSERAGVENAWQTAWQFGMVSLGQQSRGAGTFHDFLNQRVTLLESAHAFSVFSNLGRQTGQQVQAGNSPNTFESLQPVTVIRVLDESGMTLLDWSNPREISIVSPQLAYLVTDVLSDEAARWSSLGHPNPLEIGRPAGVRLGVSLDGSQAWTVGYTHQLVVGSWLGFPDIEGRQVPRLASAALWNAVIKYASQDLVVEDWDMPAGITRLPVCDPSGLLPTNACPMVVDEVFLAGNEPIQADNLYQVLRINRETGQLATVFTPAELVDEKVYLVVPDWAEPWAEQAGLPVPPQSFDPIYVAPQTTADLRLTKPVMFAHVHGTVELWGSASGSDFDYYRIQVGQGLNPTQWLLVGEDGQQPVSNGILGVWDTQGLQGLFVLQLSVIRTNQRVDTMFIQVTVDNTPPEVVILDPGAGELLLMDAEQNILLQTSASDDLGIERVEFLVDNELYLTLWQPPYACMWPATPGEHTLQVRAFDRAGNMAEQTIQFEYRR
jgi:membrane carboxypeptidase/penicillin-binding protein PbpC